MAHIQLRVQAGVSGPNDITVTVQDPTFDHLMSTISPEIRVSAYLDHDYPRIEAAYAEIYMGEDCPFKSKIIKLTPGSRTRKNIVLPAAMMQGEQLVIVVDRSPIK